MWLSLRLCYQILLKFNDKNVCKIRKAYLVQDIVESPLSLLISFNTQLLKLIWRLSSRIVIWPLCVLHIYVNWRLFEDKQTIFRSNQKFIYLNLSYHHDRTNYPLQIRSHTTNKCVPHSPYIIVVNVIYRISFTCHVYYFFGNDILYGTFDLDEFKQMSWTFHTTLIQNPLRRYNDNQQRHSDKKSLSVFDSICSRRIHEPEEDGRKLCHRVAFRDSAIWSYSEDPILRIENMFSQFSSHICR